MNRKNRGKHIRHASTQPAECCQEKKTVDPKVITEEKRTISKDVENVMNPCLSKDILMSLDIGLVVVGKDEKLLFANLCAEEMLGFSLVGNRGNCVQALLNSPVGKLLHQCLEYGISQQHVEVPGPSGILAVSTQVLSGDDDNPAVATATLKDVSEQVYLKSRLKISDSLAIVGQLTASIAHEIKNPLASISGAAELLQEESKRRNLNPQMVNLIVRETTRLVETIDHFLDFAREKPLIMESFNIEELLEEVISTMKLHGSYYPAIKIRHSSAEHILIQGDRAQLTQVFTNLLINAMQAIKGAGEITVSCNLKHSRNAVRITFTDTGIGMDPDQLKTIFEPFVSSRSTGMGLGLPIAKKILQNHSGSIQAFSREGEGSTIEVILPLLELQ